MNKRTFKIFGTLAGLYCFFSAAGMAASLKGDLTVSLKEKRVLNLSSSGLILAFHLNVANGSSTACRLVRSAYRFTVNQKEYFRLESVVDPPVPISPQGETLISFPVKLTYGLLSQAIGDLGEKAFCDLVGDLVFADDRNRETKIPIAFSGEFPVFHDPAVEFLPVDLKDLTIGGADLRFGVKFHNPNNFEFLVDRIEYSLSFGGRPVDQGSIPGDKNIEARGERTFPIPLLLNFFEIGQEVHHLLQQPSVACRLQGEVEVTTIWGKIRIPFDKAETLPVSRAN